MVEGGVDPGRHRVTVLTRRRERTGVPGCLLVFAIVAREAIRRGRFVGSGRVTLLTSETAVPADEGEEIVIEHCITPIDRVVAFLARQLEVARNVVGRPLVVGPVT